MECVSVSVATVETTDLQYPDRTSGRFILFSTDVFNQKIKNEPVASEIGNLSL